MKVLHVLVAPLLVIVCVSARKKPSRKPKKLFSEKPRRAASRKSVETEVACTIETRAAESLSETEFRREYVAKGRPLIIAGAWTADPKPEYGHTQERLEITYDLAIEFGNAMHNYPSNSLLRTREFRWRNSDAYTKEFMIPAYFTDNAMEICDQEYFQFEWLLLGNKAGGSSFHFDAYNTSAWSVVHSGGRKHWALYSPSVTPPKIPVPVNYESRAKRMPTEERYLLYSDHGVGYRTESAYNWFRDVLPTLPADRQPLQCVAGIGDIVYVPPGFWHAVQNFGDNIAFTANFVGRDLQSVSASADSLRHQANRKGNSIPNEVLAPCLRELQALRAEMAQRAGGEAAGVRAGRHNEM
jgi:hypothetical protein